jgi:hypothetical protein
LGHKPKGQQYLEVIMEIKSERILGKNNQQKGLPYFNYGKYYMRQ